MEKIGNRTTVFVSEKVREDYFRVSLAAKRTETTNQPPGLMGSAVFLYSPNRFLQ